VSSGFAVGASWTAAAQFVAGGVGKLVLGKLIGGGVAGVAAHAGMEGFKFLNFIDFIDNFVEDIGSKLVEFGGWPGQQWLDMVKHVKEWAGSVSFDTRSDKRNNFWRRVTSRSTPYAL